MKWRDMLLPECTITHTEDKQGKKEYYNSDENCTRLEYTVLVNGNTASAAEIVAAAIKDNHGGKLVGTKTFGKGIIQGAMEFNDHTALKLTIMQYLSPEGNPINGIGIKPDYRVKASAEGKSRCAAGESAEAAETELTAAGIFAAGARKRRMRTFRRINPLTLVYKSVILNLTVWEKERSLGNGLRFEI